MKTVLELLVIGIALVGVASWAALIATVLPELLDRRRHHHA
jgi:hypothetical protein